MNRKEVFTTGEVARICLVAPRTVSDWFDTGILCGYRIPGSKDRRIPRRSLLSFMSAHQIPIPLGLLGSGVLIYNLDGVEEGRLERAIKVHGREEAATFFCAESLLTAGVFLGRQVASALFLPQRTETSVWSSAIECVYGHTTVIPIFFFCHGAQASSSDTTGSDSAAALTIRSGLEGLDDIATFMTTYISEQRQ